MKNNKIRLELYAVKSKSGHLLKSEYGVIEYLLCSTKTNAVPHQKNNEGSKIIKVAVTIEEI
jgi:hypothetical protein